MDEKELINHLQILKQIRPRPDWVVLTKSRILGQGKEPVSQRVVFWQRVVLSVSKRLPITHFALMRPALAIYTIALLVGIFGLLKSSLPGDLLYPAKKAIQQTQVTVLSQDPVELHLNLAAQSAQALKDLAKRNENKKLDVVMQEYEQNLGKAAESLQEQKPKDANKVLKIAKLVNEMEQAVKEAEEALQTEIAKEPREQIKQQVMASLNEEIEDTQQEIAAIVARELQKLESASLTEEQKGLLEEAKTAYSEGNYSFALELIMRIGGR